MPPQAATPAPLRAAAPRPAARAVAVTKVYRAGAATVTALDDVTIELPSATFTAIMGPSGSGKSTLMHCLAGLDTVTAGRRADSDWLAGIVDTVGLADRLGHRPAELSGGKQQRVAVACALATRPEIVFADEPTGNLDSRAGAELLAFLRRAVDELGQSIVMVTHDPVAASYASRVVFLNDGRIVDEMTEPTAERVLDRMKQF